MRIHLCLLELSNAYNVSGRYGTSRGMIEAKRKEGKIVVLDIEMEVRFRSPSPITPQLTPQGVKQIKSACPPFPARYIFISPPSPEFETLESRLRGRGSEKEESIQKRLTQAKLELEYSKTPGVHDIIIVNDDLETAYKKLESFIFGKEEKTQDQPAANGEKAAISVLD